MVYHGRARDQLDNKATVYLINFLQSATFHRRLAPESRHHANGVLSDHYSLGKRRAADEMLNQERS